MGKLSTYFSDYIEQNELSLLGSGEIERFTLNREKRELKIQLYLDSFVPYSVVEKAQKSISHNLGISKTVFDVKFPKSEFSLDKAEIILEYIKNESSAVNGFFQDAEAELEDNVLTICLKQGGKELLEAQNEAGRYVEWVEDEEYIQTVPKIKKNGRIIYPL